MGFYGQTLTVCTFPCESLSPPHCSIVDRFISLLKERHQSIIANRLDCDIVVSKVERQSSYQLISLSDKHTLGSDELPYAPASALI